MRGLAGVRVVGLNEREAQRAWVVTDVGLRAPAKPAEQYWCPIKHARRVLGTHARYAHFLDYGDGRAYRQELEKLRRDWNGRERR